MENAARPNTSNDQKTQAQQDNEAKMTTDYAGTETEPADGEDWVDF
jgi:hypothetical protein